MSFEKGVAWYFHEKGFKIRGTLFLIIVRQAYIIQRDAMAALLP